MNPECKPNGCSAVIVSLEVKLSLSPTEKSSKVQGFEPVFYCFKLNNYAQGTFSVPSQFGMFIYIKKDLSVII
jgi:hypothetical protein